MKIKHICSFLALCCAMNQELSATISKVQEAFKTNIEKNLKDHENDMLRKCSYLNQINTTYELCKIGYQNSDFTVAVGKLTDRVKKLGGKDQLADAFKALGESHKVAATYGFYFLTQFMNDDATDWIETFNRQYADTEDGVKDFVVELSSSKEYKIVEKYYKDDEAIKALKESWKSEEGLDKDTVVEAMELLNRCGYNDVYDKYRNNERTASSNAIYAASLANGKHAHAVAGATFPFDILSECIEYADGDGVLRVKGDKLKDELGGLGELLDSTRNKYKKYAPLTENDIKGFVFQDDDLKNIKKRLGVISKLAKKFGVNIDLSRLYNVMNFLEAKLNLAIEELGEKIEINSEQDVNKYNFKNTLEGALQIRGNIKEIDDETFSALDVVKNKRKDVNNLDNIIKKCYEFYRKDLISKHDKFINVFNNIIQMYNIRNIKDLVAVLIGNTSAELDDQYETFSDTIDIDGQYLDVVHEIRTELDDQYEMFSHTINIGEQYLDVVHEIDEFNRNTKAKNKIKNFINSDFIEVQFGLFKEVFNVIHEVKSLKEEIVSTNYKDKTSQELQTLVDKYKDIARKIQEDNENLGGLMLDISSLVNVYEGVISELEKTLIYDEY